MFIKTSEIFVAKEKQEVQISITHYFNVLFEYMVLPFQKLEKKSIPN